MSSPDEDWWSLRAAEYVIGTLRGDDLDLFQRILAHDTEAQDNVLRWENWLYPLNADTTAVVPPADVWQRISDSLDLSVRQSPDWLIDEPEPVGAEISTIDEARSRLAEKRSPATPSRPRRSSSFVWPVMAMLATAASLLMGVLLHQQGVFDLGTPEATLSRTAQFTSDGTSILTDEAGEALWLVQTDHVVNLLRVTALAPPEPGAGEDYQLWQVLPDDQGVASVGLLPDEPGEVIDYEATAFEFGADAFAVSLEPDGGSPGEVPSGPVLFQNPYQTSERLSEEP